MNKTAWFLAVGAATTAGVQPGWARSAQKEKKPNIVFLLMDDMGYGDLSCMGSQKISTPNIDALAKSGKLLTQHYAGAPVSAPSRAVLMTGQHTGHAPIRGNDEWGARGDVWSHVSMANNPKLQGQAPMPADTRTLALALKDQGYATACIGKWGLGAPETASEPNKMGYDFFYGYNCQRLSHNYYPSHLWRNTEQEWINPIHELPARIHPKTENILDPKLYEPYHTGVYAPDKMQEETLKFIEQNKDRPFFLWWTTPIPHASMQAPARWVEYYHSLFGEEKPFLGGGYVPARYPHASYAALVGYVDEQIGQIVQKLKDEGVYDNTLIVFTSDNGPSSEGGGDSPWFHSARPYRSEEGWGKRSMQEGGLRVPTIVAWPGKVEPGTRSELMSGFQDWFPTLVSAAGGDAAKERGLDGVSLLPTLTGKGKQAQHDFLYWEFPDVGSMAVRQGDWKLIVKDIRKEPKVYLYNLAVDPLESNDVSLKYPEKVVELKQIAVSAHTEPENPRFKMGLPLK